MALPKTGTAGALTLALIVTATVWFFASKKQPAPESAPLRTNTFRADAITDSFERQASVPQQPNAAIQLSAPSADERAAAIKHMLTSAMGVERPITEELVKQGLSQADAEQMGRRAVDGIADCYFDAARRQFEAQGDLNEFLDHADIGWVEAALSLNRVRAAMLPCLTNIRQQTGLSLSVGEPAGGSLDERVTLPPPPPPWAAEMESHIREHVASHPGLGVADVFVKCREEGCNAVLVGSDISIFDFEFDVFAEQNGFQRAVVGGVRDRRSVWLER